jgi:hypothetical protein
MGTKKKGVERIWRNCLRCDRKFLAWGRFNRLCPRCHEMNKIIPVELVQYEYLVYMNSGNRLTVPKGG